jgi:hypothetical protein
VIKEPEIEKSGSLARPFVCLVAQSLQIIMIGVFRASPPGKSAAPLGRLYLFPDPEHISPKRLNRKHFEASNTWPGSPHINQKRNPKQKGWSANAGLPSRRNYPYN